MSALHAHPAVFAVIVTLCAATALVAKRARTVKGAALVLIGAALWAAVH